MEKNSVNINWKKEIKYMQIIFFSLLVVLYFVFSYVSGEYKNYQDLKNKYESVSLQLDNLKNKEKDLKLKITIFKQIYQNKDKFIQAYNACYLPYIKSKYLLLNVKSVSLGDCMYNKGFKNPSIKNLLTYDDIRKLAISLGIVPADKKFTYDQSRILYSLDQNIFQGNLINQAEVLTFGQPNLISKPFHLYAVAFSLKISANYEMLKNVLSRIQNHIYPTKDVYYTINSISDFDITSSDIQDVIIQGQFYFEK